jgi:TatD DNase family protein
MYKLIDTHSHLFVEEFEADRPEVMQRAREAGITRIVMPNIDMASVEPMLQVCAEYPDLCYPTIGLHPTEVKEDYRQVLAQMKAMLDTSVHGEASHAPFIAIGEVGLDLYWDKTFKMEQLSALEEQIGWALEYDLPIIIHSREAFPELYTLFAHYKDSALRGVFHSFTGTADEAHALLEFPGFMLGINGVATFKKSTLPEALREVPLSRLVVETDSPYLAPTPYRGKRNESAYVARVVEKLAEVYQCSAEQVAAQVYETSERLFFK